MSDTKPIIEIRKAGTQDINTLLRLGRDAFSETYGPFNTVQDLASHIEQTYSPDVILNNLHDESQTYLMALVDGTAAGFGLLQSGPCPNGVAANKAFKVHQLYVLQAYQRLRLGSRLIAALEELALASGGDVIWLSVWERADWARRFYLRCGFEVAGKIEFKLGSSDQTDILMTLSLGQSVN